MRPKDLLVIGVVGSEYLGRLLALGKASFGYSEFVDSCENWERWEALKSSLGTLSFDHNKNFGQDLPQNKDYAGPV